MVALWCVMDYLSSADLRAGAPSLVVSRAGVSIFCREASQPALVWVCVVRPQQSCQQVTAFTCC